MGIIFSDVYMRLHIFQSTCTICFFVGFDLLFNEFQQFDLVRQNLSCCLLKSVVDF